jgi:hypothetical protein
MMNSSLLNSTDRGCPKLSVVWEDVFSLTSVDLSASREGRAAAA